MSKNVVLIVLQVSKRSLTPLKVALYVKIRRIRVSQPQMLQKNFTDENFSPGQSGQVMAIIYRKI